MMTTQTGTGTGSGKKTRKPATAKKSQNARKANGVDKQNAATGDEENKVPEIKATPQMLKGIKEDVDKFEKLVKQAKVINAKKKEILDKWEAQGIHRSEFKNGRKMLEKDAQQRKYMDQSRQIVRKALDIPDETQLNMFPGPNTRQ